MGLIWLLGRVGGHRSGGIQSAICPQGVLKKIFFSVLLISHQTKGKH
jgi:hypothetical protein